MLFKNCLPILFLLLLNYKGGDKSCIAGKSKKIKVELERFEQTYNSSRVTVDECKVAAFNRSTKGLNCHLNFHKPCSPDTKVIGNAAIFVNNEYRQLAIHLQWKMKDAIKTKVLDVDRLSQKCMTPPLPWPPKLHVDYYIKNWSPSVFPLLSSGQYRLTGEIGDDFWIGTFSLYIKIVEVIDY